MHLTTVFTLLAGTVASVSGTTLAPKAKGPEKFNLFVQRSILPPLNGRPITASGNKLRVSLFGSDTDSRCENGPPAEGAATLFVQYQALFLYGGEYGSFQQVGVDRSEDGEGRLDYFNNLDGVPGDKDLQLKDWSVDRASNHLLFHDSSFLACPNLDDATTFTIYVEPDLDPNGPTGLVHCIPLNLVAVPKDHPDSCEYSGTY